MRTPQALAAMILAADAEAQKSDRPVAVYVGDKGVTTMRTHGPLAGDNKPVCSVYPDGRVDFYHSHLPKEVVPDVS